MLIAKRRKTTDHVLQYQLRIRHARRRTSDSYEMQKVVQMQNGRRKDVNLTQNGQTCDVRLFLRSNVTKINKSGILLHFLYVAVIGLVTVFIILFEYTEKCIYIFGLQELVKIL